MNIFIVEDDSYKYSKVLALLEKLFPAGNFTHRDSVHGAIIYLRGFSPDLIILDMSLPSHSAIAGQGSPAGTREEFLAAGPSGLGETVAGAGRT